jgi:hypothetical protein
MPVLIGVIAFLAGGCSRYNPYTPLRLDASTDLYKTSTKLEKSSILEYDTSVDPRRFRLVVLNAQSNTYPARFEFFMRTALSDLGLTLVLNRKELRLLAGMHPKLSEVSASSHADVIKEVSDVLKPVMLVDVQSVTDGERRHVTLKVIDASSNRVLLHVKHVKYIILEVDPPAHYPVLNALREWFKASTTTAS